MTPPLAAASLFGLGVAVVRRSRTRVWLIPLVGLLCLFALAILSGSLVPKFEYTAALAVFLIPFSAVTYRTLGIDGYSARGAIMATVALFFSMYAFSYPPVAPYVLPLSVNPLPRFSNQEQVIDLIVPVLRENIRDDNSGLVSDFYGFVGSGYAALLTRIHPDRVFFAPGAPNRKLDADKLSEFVDRYPRGILLLHNGSRFAEFLGYEGSHNLRIGDRRLVVRKIWAAPWSEFNKTHLRAKYDIEDPEMQLYAYQLIIE